VRPRPLSDGESSGKKRLLKRDLVVSFGIIHHVQEIKTVRRTGSLPPKYPALNTPQTVTLEISYPKALLVTIPTMACFVVGLLVIGVPMTDPLLIGFLVVMVTGMTFVFAGCMCFTLRCRIGYDGLRPAVPTFYQRVLRWEDISVVQGFASPFYFVRGRNFGGHCMLPRRFLLKRPDCLREFIDQYAPADNIVRKKLAA
jgi:hypothetical protein